MTEMEITYIFTRYISVTIKRQAKAFYRRYNRIFYYENKELIENIEIEDEMFKSYTDSSRSVYKNIEERLSYQDLLFEGLNSLNDMEKQIICEKYIKIRSDADIGKDFSISSQMISKRKRKIIAKLKSLFSS